MKRIADLMTRQPWTVQIDDSLAVARQMIAAREIRHLPVLDGGEVVGMLTERDLALAAARLGTVSEAMIPVRCVAPDTPFGDMLEMMTTERRDAIVVTGDGTVEGIFTASDAVRVLRDLVLGRAKQS